MKPIIFVRIADMKYYKGITENDVPDNGGSYVKENKQAHECYNFDSVTFEDEKEYCLGFAMLTGGRTEKEIQLHIEKIVGCQLARKEDAVDDVIVVWVSKARNSQNMRVVGFYKHAKVYRQPQYAEFESGYMQQYNFVSEKKDCVLLPYKERHGNNKWYVPSSQRNYSTFGFGRASVWYAGTDTKDEKELEYVERMIASVEGYQGENWIDKGGAQ